MRRDPPTVPAPSTDDEDGHPTSSAPARGEAPPRRRVVDLVRRPEVLVAVLLCLPLVVIAVRAVAGGWRPTSGDVSLIELRVRDVGSADTPLLGSYGRYGFNHPGPLWFYVLAGPLRLLGQLEVGVALAGVLSVAAAVRVAARHDRLLWVGALMALLVWGAGPRQLTDAWEPHGLLLVSVALVLLTYDVVAGHVRSLPLVAVAASVLGTAQATLLPLAVALGTLAVVATLVARPERWRLWAGVAAGVVAVAWAPTLAQQLTGDVPNLTAMADARSSPEPSLGLADAWRAVAGELRLRASWVGFDAPLEPLSTVVDVGAAPLVPVGAVALGAAALRWRHPATIVAAVAVISAVVAMSQLLGPVFAWIPEWLRVVGFVTWLAAGWALAGRVLAARVPTFVLGAALVASSTASVVRAVVVDPAEDRVGDAVRALVADLDVPPGPVLVTSDAQASLVFGGQAVGLEVVALELDRRGVDVVVAAEEADRFGPRRARPERAASQVRIVTVEEGGVDPLSADERRRRDELLDELDLPTDAVSGDVLRAIEADPSVRDAGIDLLGLPELPRFDLVVERCDGPGGCTAEGAPGSGPGGTGRP